MEVNKCKANEEKLSKKKVYVIGIGGVSRAGKSSSVRYLKNLLNVDLENIFQIDKYLIKPIRKFDQKFGDFILDWEDPKTIDLDKFYLDLRSRIDYLRKNPQKDVDIIIAEGFLLYYEKDISDLIDVKILLDVDKEIARSRRKATKDYPNDYYYDEYIWKGWIKNNLYFDEENPKNYKINFNQEFDGVILKIKDLLRNLDENIFKI